MSEPATAPSFRRSIAVVIGIDGYGHGVPPLRTAVNDARRLARAPRHPSRLRSRDAAGQRGHAGPHRDAPQGGVAGPGRPRRPRLPLLRRPRRGRRRARRPERLPVAGGRLARRREHLPLDAAGPRSDRRPALPAHAGHPRFVLLGSVPLERHPGGVGPAGGDPPGALRALHPRSRPGRSSPPPRRTRKRSTSCAPARSAAATPTATIRPSRWPCSRRSRARATSCREAPATA